MIDSDQMLRNKMHKSTRCKGYNVTSNSILNMTNAANGLNLRLIEISYKN